jgi:nickel/cobalt exporter
MTKALLSLLSAFILGLSHSLEPSHAKVVLASYFLNRKRTLREAVAFALTVTVAHTFTIYVLAIVGFVLGPLMKNESVESWGEFLGGILMMAIGLWMFWGEVRARFHKDEESCDHHHCGHDHSHGHFFHHHHYTHDHPQPSSMKQIFALGFCSGAVPCTMGLAVLLQAWSSHAPLFGLLLVGTFSLGLGVVVLVMCLLMRRMASKMEDYLKKATHWTRLLPVLSSAIIFLMGLFVTLQGLPYILKK